MDIHEFQTSVKAAVDARLAEMLSNRDAFDSRVNEAVRYSVFGGGKHVRPALMAATAMALGRSYEPLLPAMCAIAMIHSASLILDDLPCMDNAHLRHGRSPVHKAFDEATAILAAMSLLNRAYGLLASLAVEDARNTRVIEEAVRAIGPEGLIGGQVVEVSSRGRGMDHHRLAFVQGAKTGALMIAAVRIAALLCQATAEELAALTNHARAMGAAYQICDDVLRHCRAPAELGKQSHGDDPALDAVGVYGETHAREMIAGLTNEAIAALAPFREPPNILIALARSLAARTH